jgi:diadenosine tetraphosphate (Ap4A) HIT family hydrolase
VRKVSIIGQVENARKGNEPALICRVSSGWVVLANRQYLRGYCILISDPIVSSINDLANNERVAFLCDMAAVGDALMDVTGAYRINYAILGNTDPVLHAHIVPRYLSEPDQYRQILPWSYPQEMMDGFSFNFDRDNELKQRLEQAITQKLAFS